MVKGLVCFGHNNTCNRRKLIPTKLGFVCLFTWSSIPAGFAETAILSLSLFELQMCNAVIARD